MVDSSLIFNKDITIYSDPSQFIFQKQSDKNTSSFISFNKDSYKVKRLSDYQPKISSGVQVYSILGLVNGKNNFYLLGVNRATFIGKILNSNVFKIEEICYISNLSSESSNIIPEEDEKYITMINEFLKRNDLFFSDTMDLTLNMQSIFGKLSTKTNNERNSFLFPNSVEHFCWNLAIAKLLNLSELEGLVHPVINGYVGIKTSSDYSNEFTYAVIARKDSRRSGMRFLVRGNDRNGYSANFAETEQILIEKNRTTGGNFRIMSYLQLRGSIPLLWTQAPNLQLNPVIRPRDDYSENLTTFRKHVGELVGTYGKIVFVNLIDKKNDQKGIGDYFMNLSKDLKETKSNPIKDQDYVWFDFHQECKNMKYQNLSKLLKITSVSQALNGFDYFLASITNESIDNKNYIHNLDSNDFKVLSVQKGSFRTNCIDSLDRTNVVQTVFSRQILHKMMHHLNLSEGPNGEAFQEFNPVFEAAFKVTWADHGDHLAHCYSGTGALKSDFVRTGKRTKKGALEDGVKTSTRFYINNFCDGYNQDCHDYFLKKISPKQNTFKEHSTTTVKALAPATFLLVFGLYYFLINIAFPKEYEDNYRKKMLKFMIFIGVLLVTFKTTFNTLKKSIIDTPTLDHS